MARNLPERGWTVKVKGDWIMRGFLALIAGGLWMNLLVQGIEKVDAQSPNVPDVVKAHKFVLVDDKGNTRASLDTDKDGPCLCLYDTKGKIRGKLDAKNDGSCLSLCDTKGNTRAMLNVDNDGTPSLSLYDANAKIRVGLAVGKDGSSLNLYDDNIKYPRATLGVAHMINRDTGDKITTQPSTLTLSDLNGNIIFQAPLKSALLQTGYRNIEVSHNIKSVSDNGQVIILDDNSVWSVPESEGGDCCFWSQHTNITVTYSTDLSYPYFLINTDKPYVKKVHARLISQ